MTDLRTKMIMQPKEDKRLHRRLDMKLPLEYRYAELSEGLALQSLTSNISTGGLYFETTDEGLQPGDVLAFKLGIPADDARFPQHTTISTEGTVVRSARVEAHGYDKQEAVTRFGIAAEFQKGFKLVF